MQGKAGVRNDERFVDPTSLDSVRAHTLGVRRMVRWMCAVALCSLLTLGAAASAHAADPLSAIPSPSGVDITPEPLLPADNEDCADLAADPSRFTLYGRSAVGRDPADGIAFLVGNEQVGLAHPAR